MLKISASNFGPIIEGTVELKPLTVFVGPNNAGKSYMAMLIYSLFKAMPRGAGIAPYFRDFGRDFTSIASRRLFSPYQLGLEDEITREQQDEFLTWARELPNSSSKEHRRILISELPQFFKDLTRRAIDQSAEDFADALERELQRCFGATISDLNCTFEPSQPFKIRINRQQPPWEVGIASSNGAIELNLESSTCGVHVEGVERFTKCGNATVARARILPDHFMFLLEQ